MVIHFYIKYKTEYGQSVYININPVLSEPTESQISIALNYLNEEYWHGILDTKELTKKESIIYHYVIKEDGKTEIPDLCRNRMVIIKKRNADEIKVYDDWQHLPLLQHVFNSKPFLEVFNHKSKIKESNSKNPSHIFYVQATYLSNGYILCLTGSAKKMNKWDKTKPVFLKKKKNAWCVKLKLTKEDFPVEYKFGIYDVNKKEVIYLEERGNRILNDPAEKDKLNIIHEFVYFHEYAWKGAGVNVPLSAIKSEQSWGIGDFTDLKMLTDWAGSCGIKMIQLLPLNDTTANHDRSDSYPYSAISAFALHPVFLNSQKLAISVSLEFPDEILQQVHELNQLPDLDYETVARIKNNAIKELYEKDKLSFKDDFAFFDFFDLNRYWLVPYAAFCYLRDKYKTPDFNEWENYRHYDEDMIQAFVSPESPHYDEIGIHYFTQYHLHLQLLDSKDYAHKNQVILKGDVPIGIGRFSVDTWMHPELFRMNMQAGAPPDAFTSEGQNWGFPTYNWEAMRENNYAWWRQRLEHMSNYFDAVRIDHVLGFFRIWSIPLNAVEGIFGRFVPAHPLFLYDFEMAGIDFNEERFCKPFLTDIIINEQFGENASWVKDIFFAGNNFL